MGLNETPSANRLHIGFFGCRNAGKSSLVNAVTGQNLAVVSDIKGTTTDPVSKAMELLPLGAVVIIDTPGFDDLGELGEKRVEKTKQILNKTDIAVIVIDAGIGLSAQDEELIEIIKSKEIPYLLAYNKCDLEARTDISSAMSLKGDAPSISVSAEKGINIHELKEAIGKLAKTDTQEKRLVSDLISEGDLIVLVTPIDESAPKGRIILPQQQTIRDILDANAIAIVTKETELEGLLNSIGKVPKLVITDSQAFNIVSKIVPESIPLTSFSILMARYKGFLDTAMQGIAAIDRLNDGDTVLIAEGCTHHRQCNDIGTVKIPRWLRAHSSKTFEIVTCSGTEFPEDLSRFSVIIHCGGCMLNEREVQSRMKSAIRQGVPFINYGVLIAKINGILDRSVEIIYRDR